MNKPHLDSLTKHGDSYCECKQNASEGCIVDSRLSKVSKMVDYYVEMMSTGPLLLKRGQGAKQQLSEETTMSTLR